MEEFLRYLANERNASPRTLKAYRHALTSFRAENKTSWKKCAADDFRNYLFADHETRAGAFVRATAILSITHFLSVSRVPGNGYDIILSEKCNCQRWRKSCRWS